MGQPSAVSLGRGTFGTTFGRWDDNLSFGRIVDEDDDWKERAMKLERAERTSASEAVATTISTSASPSNCDPCATQRPLTHTIAQPSKYIFFLIGVFSIQHVIEIINEVL